MDQHFEIVGSGLYLPRVVLTAADIDRRAGVESGWTMAHVGIERRHECVAPETLGSMAVAAAQGALADAGLQWRDVDLIIDASASRHQPIPCNAAHLQASFGPDADGIPCFDIQSTCLGFLIALNVANGLFAVGGPRTILIVCTEAGLAGVNWQEPESAALLGDGAAAVIVRKREPTPTYHFVHETFARHIDICQVKGGAHNLSPFDYGPHNDADFRFHMDGGRLFRVALKYLPPMTSRLLDAAGLDRRTLDVIPHQASPRGVEAARRLLEFSAERYHVRMNGMGNMVSASIPAVLHLCRREGRLGGDVLLIGTSAGYSQAGLVFRI